MTANAMNQLIRLYSAVELTLRHATTQNAPQTMAELKTSPRLTEVATNPSQIASAIETLVRQGYAHSEGERVNRRYKWADMNKTYTPTKRQIKAAETQAHKPVDPRKEGVMVQAMSPTIHREVELVISGVTIVVGKNPETGRPRINIEG